MVATNRLTGHSSGFFSVYTLPPNQAVSVESQVRINAKRNQIPPRREVGPIIFKKTRTLLSKLTPSVDASLWKRGKQSVFITGSAARTPKIRAKTVQLVVTSPPFLDVVNYKQDNWLRCWFNGIDPNDIDIWHLKKAEEWQIAMTTVFKELFRVLRPGGFVAFEVGEVRNGKILLEDLVVPAGVKAGLNPGAIFINDQKFTKTSNCWGVNNLTKGDKHESNRFVLSPAVIERGRANVRRIPQRSSSGESEAAVSLIESWSANLRQAVEEDLAHALPASGTLGTQCPIRPGSTNQSIGNQVEGYYRQSARPPLAALRSAALQRRRLPRQETCSRRSSYRDPYGNESDWGLEPVRL